MWWVYQILNIVQLHNSPTLKFSSLIPLSNKRQFTTKGNQEPFSMNRINFFYWILNAVHRYMVSGHILHTMLILVIQVQPLKENENTLVLGQNTMCSLHLAQNNILSDYTLEQKLCISSFTCEVCCMSLYMSLCILDLNWTWSESLGHRPNGENNVYILYNTLWTYLYLYTFFCTTCFYLQLLLAKLERKQMTDNR